MLEMEVNQCLCLHTKNSRRYMAKILPIRLKTLSNQSIIQDIPKYYDLHLKRRAVARNRRGGGQGGHKSEIRGLHGTTLGPKKVQDRPMEGVQGGGALKKPRGFENWKQFVSSKYVISN